MTQAERIRDAFWNLVMTPKMFESLNVYIYISIYIYISGGNDYTYIYIDIDMVMLYIYRHVCMHKIFADIREF